MEKIPDCDCNRIGAMFGSFVQAAPLTDNTTAIQSQVAQQDATQRLHYRYRWCDSSAGGGAFGPPPKEITGGAAAGIRAVHEHGQEFVPAQGLDHLDEGEGMAGADGDGFDAEMAATGFAPLGEPGAGLFEGDDGEGGSPRRARVTPPSSQWPRCAVTTMAPRPPASAAWRFSNPLHSSTIRPHCRA